MSRFVTFKVSKRGAFDLSNVMSRVIWSFASANGSSFRTAALSSARRLPGERACE
jgi:hypothetical protein